MNCEQIHTQLIDYLDGNLDNDVAKEIEKHIEHCDRCINELQELGVLLRDIDKEPQQLPDRRLRSNFDELLKKEIALQNDTKVVSLETNSKSYWKMGLQVAATVALVVSAYFYGKTNSKDSYLQEMATLEKEKMEMKETMTISLIENESASKRLQAVNYAEEFEKPGNEILKALINKMYYDDQMNVRLAAAEALAKFAQNDLVRDALISALEKEEDPGMQIELIQILVSIQEKRAVPLMEKLLQNEATPNYVKDQVKVVLPSLI